MFNINVTIIIIEGNSGTSYHAFEEVEHDLLIVNIISGIVTRKGAIVLDACIVDS